MEGERVRVVRAYAGRLLMLMAAVALFVLVVWFLIRLIQGSPDEDGVVEAPGDSTAVIEVPNGSVGSATIDNESLPNTGPAETFAVIFVSSLTFIYGRRAFLSHRALQGR